MITWLTRLRDVSCWRAFELHFTAVACGPTNCPSIFTSGHGDRFPVPSGAGERPGIELNPKGIRPALLFRNISQPGHSRGGTAEGSLGSPQRAQDRIFKSPHQTTASEDRTAAIQAEISPDSTLGRVQILHAPINLVHQARLNVDPPRCSHLLLIPSEPSSPPVIPAHGEGDCLLWRPRLSLTHQR